MSKNYTIKETKELPRSEVLIRGEMPASALTDYRGKALKHLGEHLELPGFRKGHIPENVIISKLGEMAILEHAAEDALIDATTHILIETKLNYITQPKISVTKLAPGNPIEFTITVAVMPKIELADYKKIAREEMKKAEEPAKATDEDIEKTIEDIRERFAKYEQKDAKEKPPLPEVNDEFIKKLGDFKDVADFKVKLAENITLEKEHRNKEKKRIAIVEELVKKTTIDIPQAFIEQELAIMLARFKDDVVKMGLKFDDYLKHLNKKEEDLRKDWESDAEKKSKLELILAQIALEEKIRPEEEKVTKETEHLIEHYPGAEKDRTRAYVIKQMVQDLVFEFLEKTRN